MEQNATHKVTIGGETVFFNAADYDTVVPALVQKHGGVPQVEPLEVEQRQTPVPPAPETKRSAPPSRPDQSDVDSEGVSTSGKARAQADEDAAKAAGFSPKDPVFSIGRRVVQYGVEEAQRRRQAFDDLPLAKDAFGQFAEKIDSEQRVDRIVKLTDLKMAPNGDMEVRYNGKVFTVPVAQNAFEKLMGSRLQVGGGRYLSDCWPELRAYNVNAWLAHFAEQLKGGDKEPTIVLRVRNKIGGTREIYGVVSEKYQGDFDAAAIARALAEAAPDNARGEVSYDGLKAKFDVLFHSNVKADEYVAGEIFRAGASVRTDDIGGGSIRTSGMIERNLCLNLIILDKAEKETARVMHKGDLDNLVQKFSAGFSEAMDSIAHFRDAWGFANAEKVVEAAATSENLNDPDMTMQDLLAGIFWAQLRNQRELVSVVRGNRKQVTRELVGAVMRDEKRPERVADVTRATIINGWTRYAHENAGHDPWLEDGIERAASSMLPNKGKAKPLPFEAFPGELSN